MASISLENFAAVSLSKSFRAVKTQWLTPGDVHLAFLQCLVEAVVGRVQDELDRHAVLGEVVAHAAEDVHGLGAGGSGADLQRRPAAVRAGLVVAAGSARQAEGAGGQEGY